MAVRLAKSRRVLLRERRKQIAAFDSELKTERCRQASHARYKTQDRVKSVTAEE
jgi:hypothetical protein